jgi:IS30 family transposase
MENTPNRSGTCVSHEAIYRWIYAHPAKTLREQGILLRSRRTTRQRRPPPGERQRGSRLIGMVSIDARPAEVLSRRVPGAWEGDLIMGRMNQTAVATLVERSSRFVILIALPQGKNAEGLADAVIDKVRTLPALMRQSLTWDQGTEMAEHARITLATELPIYFAHPHSPWERPSNENTNGLIREYLPKGTDIDVSQSYLNRIANELNNRPRQTLGFYTPKEVFNRFIKENAERDQCACTV